MAPDGTTGSPRTPAAGDGPAAAADVPAPDGPGRPTQAPHAEATQALDLTDAEQIVFTRSQDPGLTRRRQKQVLLFGLLAAPGAVLAALTWENRWALGLLLGAYVLLTMVEKLAYGNGVLLYKGLIRKLTARVEALEAQVSRPSGTAVVGDEQPLAAVLDLPLHDARLDELSVDWAAGTCTLSLETAAPIHEAAGPHALTFHGVRRVELPHEGPWGDSAQVNGLALEGSTCALEMQSGDTIRIEAEAIAFSPRASADAPPAG